MEVLKVGRDEDIGELHWERRRDGGEHTVKQFMNLRVKSSREEVTVHARNELVCKQA